MCSSLRVLRALRGEIARYDWSGAHSLLPGFYAALSGRPGGVVVSPGRRASVYTPALALG